jgi:hypothetical protein
VKEFVERAILGTAQIERGTRYLAYATPPVERRVSLRLAGAVVKPKPKDKGKTKKKKRKKKG